MSNVIEFNNVSKKFKTGEKFNSLRDAIPNFFRQAVKKEDELAEREFWAVKDVSFNIGKGEVVGIMGPNGAGKSTVLKLLSRIIVPNKGSMAIHGRLSALIEVTAGFHAELTGRENVYLNATILGMKKKEIDAKFEDIVEFSGVREFIDTPVKRYSSGMYSRLGFSVAAHMDPDILLVDEVLSVGDIAFQAKCAQKMRELMRSGATIVLVSHNLSLIQSLCRRVVLLNKGQMLKDGPTDDVIPYYENIVLKKQEEEFTKKVQTAPEYRVHVNTESKVAIAGVRIEDGAGVEKEYFKTDDEISLSMSYDAKESIPDPKVKLELIRADGVVCCSSSSDANGFSLGNINGRGSVKITLGKLNLGPGIYMLRLSIWDKDLIHPFAIRHSDVLRIASIKGQIESTAVFFPAVKWETT